jgi:hypothetical protein
VLGFTLWMNGEELRPKHVGALTNKYKCCVGSFCQMLRMYTTLHSRVLFLDFDRRMEFAEITPARQDDNKTSVDVSC